MTKRKLPPISCAIFACALSLANGQDITISEIHYLGSNEFIEIHNQDSTDVDLTGWNLLVDSINYSLSGLGTIPAGTRSVYTFPAAADNISDSGAELVINDNGGTRQFIVEMDNWTYTASALGFSVVYHNPSECLNSNDQRAWRPGGVMGGTPGSTEPEMTEQVYVNEVRTRSGDAIELYNPNNNDVNVANWQLLKDLDTRVTLASLGTVPNTVVPANGYLVVTPYSLSSSGEPMFLISPNGGVHGNFFTGFSSGDSMERYVDSAGAEHFVLQPGESLGRANQLPDHFDDLVISEIHYHPSALGGDSVEFIELQNVSGASVDLAVDQYRVAGVSAFGTHMLLTSANVIDSGETVTLASSTPDQFNAGSAILTAGFTSTLSNTSDFIELQKFEDNQWVTIDSVCYQDGNPWPNGADGIPSANNIGQSIQRLNGSYLGSDPANWRAAEISPGTPALINPGDLIVCPEGGQIDIQNVPGTAERIMVFESIDLISWTLNSGNFLAVDPGTNSASMPLMPNGRLFFRFSPAGAAP